MAQVTIHVNGRPYMVGCEDGQEPHLTELARLFDRQVRQVSADVGQLGETRLFLMGALLLADELSDMNRPPEPGRHEGRDRGHPGARRGGRKDREAGGGVGRVTAPLAFRHSNPYLDERRVVLRLSSKISYPRDLNLSIGTCSLPWPWLREYGAHLLLTGSSGLKRLHGSSRRRHPFPSEAL